ncbi:MAG TPA: hypothetical protein VKZ58_07445 [Longimicrobiales bacterium]|nr:hypothetical protein [Longimicrobiales bacterium]
MGRGTGGARKGERRPRGRKRAPGGKRLGRLTARGAEIWVSHSGKTRGIGAVTEGRARDVRGGVRRGGRGEPDAFETVLRER